MWEKICPNCGWKNCGSKTHCDICKKELDNKEKKNVNF